MFAFLYRSVKQLLHFAQSFFCPFCTLVLSDKHGVIFQYLSCRFKQMVLLVGKNLPLFHPFLIKDSQILQELGFLATVNLVKSQQVSCYLHFFCTPIYYPSVLFCSIKTSLTEGIIFLAITRNDYFFLVGWRQYFLRSSLIQVCKMSNTRLLFIPTSNILTLFRMSLSIIH